MKANYHTFTKGIPIIFVENFSDFSERVGVELNELEQTDLNGSKNYCRLIGFKKSPLKFIVFEDSMMRTLFGGRNHDVIDATLAYYMGQKKYPLNEKLALTFSIKLTMTEGRVGAFELLKKSFNQKYDSTCPYVMEKPEV